MDDKGYVKVYKEWLQNPNLSKTDCIMLGLLNSLCKKNDYCWATNKYLGQELGINETSASSCINKLKKLKLILVENNIPARIKNAEDNTYYFTQQRYIFMNNEEGREKRTQVMKDQKSQVMKNHEQYNNIINNISNNNISKDISIISATGAPETKDELNNNTKNTNMGNEVILEENVFEKDFLEPAAQVEVKPKKRKQGVNLAPYIDAIKDYYTAYKDISNALINYVIQVNRQRAVWTLEEWHEVLDYLYNSTSISIPGTKGRKVMVNQVLEKIEFALRGNGTTPYMDFKNEPPSANRENFVPSFIKKGY